MQWSPLCFIFKGKMRVIGHEWEAQVPPNKSIQITVKVAAKCQNSFSVRSCSHIYWSCSHIYVGAAANYVGAATTYTGAAATYGNRAPGTESHYEFYCSFPKKCSHCTCSGELKYYRIFMPSCAFIRS